MRNIPYSVLHSWPTPNYINPVTRGVALLITTVVLLSIVSILLVLRVYTRIFLQRWFGSDDVLIIIAFFLTTGFTTVILLAEQQYGFDRHVWDINFRSVQNALIFGFTIKLVFGVTCSCIRISFLCFYHRLVARTASAWFRAVTYIVWVYVVGVFIAGLATSIFACRPIEAYWVFPVQPGSHCLDDGLVGAIMGSLHCLADFLVTLLPVPIILSLQLPARVRFATLVLLQLGIVVTIAGALRTYYTWTSFKHTYDVTWASYPVWFAAAVEINLGMICACIPACRPLFIRVLTPPFSTIGSRFTTKAPKTQQSGPSSSQVVLPTSYGGAVDTQAGSDRSGFSNEGKWRITPITEDDTECSGLPRSDKSSQDFEKPWPAATVTQVDVGIAV